MNHHDLQNILLNLRQISTENKLQLDALVAEYPFFTLGKVLQLKYLHDQEPENFSDQLKVVAVQVADRTRLKELMENRISEIKYIHSEPNLIQWNEILAGPVQDEKLDFVSNEVTSSEIKNKNISFSVDDVLAATKQVDSQKEGLAILEEQAETLLNENFETESLSSSTNLVPENEIKSEEILKTKADTKLNKIKVETIDLEDNAALEAIDKKWKALLDSDQVQIINAENEQINLKVEELNLNFQEEEKPNETPEQAEQRKSRLEWFSSYAHKATIKRIPKIEEIVRVSDNYLGAESMDIQDFVADFKLPEEVNANKPNPVKTIEELEKEPLVTETLANLYAEYGRREDAIEIYEKLGLLYPEKLSYFANLIEKLK